MIDVYSYKGPGRKAPAYWVMYWTRLEASQPSARTWIVPGTHDDDPAYAAARAEGLNHDS